MILIIWRTKRSIKQSKLKFWAKTRQRKEVSRDQMKSLRVRTKVGFEFLYAELTSTLVPSGCGEARN